MGLPRRAEIITPMSPINATHTSVDIFLRLGMQLSPDALAHTDPPCADNRAVAPVTAYFSG
jgi:hypothetical protein